MPFLGTDLVVRRVNATEWALVEPLLYRGELDYWEVPVGFETDFASVPRVTAWLIPRTGIYSQAAVLHDWFCRVGIEAGQISAVDADGVFRRVLRELGVGPVLRWLMWIGVRWSAITASHRRPDWWSTAPAVFGISLLALPLVAIPGAAVAVALIVYDLVERSATRGRRGASART